MKVLIKNNKLNMDICVLQACIERNYGEEYYGTFDECVAEMRRRATDKLDFSECELGSISEDGDTCFMVDEDDQSGYAWGEAYGNNIDLMILRLTQD